MKKTVSIALTTLTLTGCGISSLPTARSIAPAPLAARAMTPADFYANPVLESQNPTAYSSRPEALAAVRAIADTAEPGRLALVKAVQADATLSAAIAIYPTLTWAQQLPVIQRVMALEGPAMGFTLPPVVIQDGPTDRPSFFDFDPAQPGPGKVILYPQGIAKETNPYAGLLLAIHEVRHSAQFQLAFGPAPADPAMRALAQGFKASYVAQKGLFGHLSFCDFCGLLNEYEAFQSANEIVGRLTNWQVDTSDMGCLSSQYDASGHLRIDLVRLAAQAGPAHLLDAFNAAEKPQFVILGGAAMLKRAADKPMLGWPLPVPSHRPLPCTADLLHCGL